MQKKYYCGIVGEVIWGTGLSREEAKEDSFDCIRQWNSWNKNKKVKLSDVKVLPCGEETYYSVSENGFWGGKDSFVKIDGLIELSSYFIDGEFELENLSAKEIRILIATEQNRIKKLKKLLKEKS